MPSLSLYYHGFITNVPSAYSSEARIIDRDLANTLNRVKEQAYSLTTRLTRFIYLKDTWQHETRFLSSISAIIFNSSYQQIIGLGEEAVPWILKELEKKPDHWFWALQSITGINPIKTSNQGNMKEMSKDWLEWGKKNGYL